MRSTFIDVLLVSSGSEMGLNVQSCDGSCPPGQLSSLFATMAVIGACKSDANIIKRAKT